MMPRSAAAAAGGLAGLTWAAGFREYMASLAGTDSKVSWYGTFGTILLPAAAIGALFGWAEHRRATGEDLPYRRAIGAASGVALAAIGGGYAVAGRGPTWTRVTTGVVAAAIAVGAGASVPSIGGSRLAISTPRGALTAVLGAASVLTFALAASVPFRGRSRARNSAV